RDSLHAHPSGSADAVLPRAHHPSRPGGVQRQHGIAERGPGSDQPRARRGEAAGRHAARRAAGRNGGRAARQAPRAPALRRRSGLSLAARRCRGGWPLGDVRACARAQDARTGVRGTDGRRRRRSGRGGMNGFTASWVIARKELQSLFLSPLAWIVLAVVQFIMAWMFLLQLDAFPEAQAQYAMLQRTPPGVGDLIVAPLFSTASIIMLMVVPLLTMRLVAEEKRTGTIALLRAAPIGTAAIVLGKFLAVAAFLALPCILLAAMPLSLASGTDLDTGRLLASTLGLFLMTIAFASAGLFMSTLTKHAGVAAIGTFGLLLLLLLGIGRAPGR